jgi:hypothetical protein
MKTFEQLHVELEQAVKDCDRYNRPAHQVRNCPSDLQDYDQAWRRRQNLEYQIRQIEKGEKIY